MNRRWAFLIAFSVVFIIIAAGRSCFADIPESEIAEFQADYSSKQSCMRGAARRIGPCTSTNCDRGVYLFLTRCLEKAGGDKHQFCENLSDQVDSLGEDIFDSFCDPYGADPRDCKKLIDYADTYCNRIP